MTATDRSLHVGRYTLKIRTIEDYDGDYSWLGEWCERSDYPKRTLPLYSREADAIQLRPFGLWHDRRGRIVAEPGWDRSRREYQYIRLEGGGDGYASEHTNRLKYLFQDADRILGLERGDWYFMGIAASIEVDAPDLGGYRLARNPVIGVGSVYGMESDSERSYFRETSREVAREAIQSARALIATLCPA